MKHGVLTGRPSSTLDGEWQPKGKGPHDRPENRVAYNLLHAPAIARWVDNVALTELRVTFVEDGALVMLKGTRKGKKLVSWYKGQNWQEALCIVATSIDSGYSGWLQDKPPPWLRKRK